MIIIIIIFWKRPKKYKHNCPSPKAFWKFSLFFSSLSFLWNCGGRIVTEIIKVKLIGPLAHPRMQICLRRPISGCWGNQTKGRVNITKGEFSIRPRTKSFSAVWIQGWSECHLVTNVFRSYITTKGGVRDLRVRKKRKTNIYNNSCLRINCLLTNSLAALMWRWCLNNDEATLQLLVGGSRRCEMGQKEIPWTQPTRVWWKWYEEDSI